MPRADDLCFFSESRPDQPDQRGVHSSSESSEYWGQSGLWQLSQNKRSLAFSSKSPLFHCRGNQPYARMPYPIAGTGATAIVFIIVIVIIIVLLLLIIVRSHVGSRPTRFPMTTSPRGAPNGRTAHSCWHLRADGLLATQGFRYDF